MPDAPGVSPATAGNFRSRVVISRKPLNKSILDLSEGAESGAELAPDLIRGPDSATLHQALACSIRDKPSMAAIGALRAVIAFSGNGWLMS